MIQKIKDIMAVSEQVSEISAKLKEHNSSVIELKDSINSLKNEMRDVKGAQKELISNLRDGIGAIDDVKEDMKKELYEFNMLKGKIQAKIIEKFESELKKELDINLDFLKGEVQNYEKLKKEIEGISNSTVSASSELRKFVDIAQSIKKEDYMLTKYYNNILEADNEKLKLMKRVDELENLISKMRRGKSQVAQNGPYKMPFHRMPTLK